MPPNVRANARFVLNPGSRSARIEVTRQIEAGGEIFVSYGAEYWKNAQSTSHLTSDVPDWEWDCLILFLDPPFHLVHLVFLLVPFHRLSWSLTALFCPVLLFVLLCWVLFRCHLLKKSFLLHSRRVRSTLVPPSLGVLIVFLAYWFVQLTFRLVVV